MISSPLYDLAHTGNLDDLRQWIQGHPDDLNAWIGDGYSPLHVACMFGHEAIVRYLLEQGALVNLNAMNASRATPLHLATGFRDEDIAIRMVKTLVDHGAELNAPQAGGQTPLHHAVASGGLGLVEVLVMAGADPHIKDEQGRSAMDLAHDLIPERFSEGHGARIRNQLKKAFSLPLQ